MAMAGVCAKVLQQTPYGSALLCQAAAAAASGSSRRRDQQNIAAAASGGSRRDHQKIVARTQHRRARHVKGVTPSKPELMNELQDEENADAILDELAAEEDYEEDEEDEEEEEEDEEAIFPLPEEDEAAAIIPVEMAKASSYIGDKWVPRPEEEPGRCKGEKKKKLNQQQAQQSVGRTAQKLALIGKDAMDASREAAEAVGKEAFGLGQTLLEAAEQATGMAADAPGMASGAQGMAGGALSNSRPMESDAKELVESRRSYPGKEVLKNKQGGLGQVQSSAGQVQQQQQQQKEAKEEEELLGSDKKYKSAGKEVMRKFQGMGRGDDHTKEGCQGDENANYSYTGLRVLVAGASGRTGRLIVENLVEKGVPVRALVRDVNKTRKIKQLDKAELVVGDLYKYESVKQALGDSNVVICAIGLQGFTLDLLETYKTEYEGVVNLISAATNNGDVKKFVFITTIGLGSFLQIIPLLFWKRQAELFLQRSGLDYTIVRPGGLRNDSGLNESVELRPADTQYIGAISRSKVAEVCVTALITPESSEKIVEIVAGSGRTRRAIEDQFAAI